MVWIAQGVDFSTPCRQRLISFKPLTNRQKYKTLGSSTLLRKAAFGVPVFFGVQGSSTLLCKAAFGVPVFFGVQNIHRLKALKLRIFPLGFQLGHPHRKTCGQSFMADICGANVLTTHRKTCGQSFMADICGANVLTTHRKTCGQSFMADICGANVLTTHRKTCGQSFMADICGANVLTLSFPKPFRYSPSLPFCMNRTGKILSFFPVLY